jgi:RND family efflux transporter MFP subunit
MTGILQKMSAGCRGLSPIAARHAALAAGALLGAGMLLSTVACSGEKPAASAQTEVVRNVALNTAERARVPDTLETTGTVRAAQTSTVSAQTMGNIAAIHAKEGDRVQRGQVLAVIDDSQPRAALDRATAAETAAQQDITAADADFNLTQATLKRYQDLYDKKSVSPQEFDEIKARFQVSQARRDMSRAGLSQARAAAAQARTAFEYTRLRAPFAGVVTEKKADPGTLASPGMPVFTVEDTRRYRLETTVNESEIRLVKQGQKVPVTIDTLGDRGLQGTVAQIVPAADPASRSFLVKIDLAADPALRSGLFGRAGFARGERNSVMIVRTSVVERGQLQGVYVLGANQVAELRYVTLGRPQGDKVEVLSGLDGGERVVATPLDRDFAGKKIE